MNTVIRKCKRCGATGEDGDGFTYMRDSIYSCWECGSKYTYITNIIEADE